jgi:hypothetical protein
MQEDMANVSDESKEYYAIVMLARITDTSSTTIMLLRRDLVWRSYVDWDRANK